MKISYYINQIETKIKRLSGDTRQALWEEYNHAFDTKDDLAFLRKLRVINEKINQEIDRRSFENAN